MKMLKKNLLKALGLSVALLSTTANAMSLDWNGGYRFEWTEVDRPSLATPTQRKAYGLNYLYLSPKIIAADGVNIISRFDVLNSSAYPNSQVGEIWGMNTNTNPGNAENQGSTDIKVSQLYLNVNQEYGALIVGRAPFEFGLGMTYSAGKGAFDHWYDTRDMVAYKVVIGDWFIMPVLSRKQSSGFGQGGTITTQGFQLQYESEENKSLIGVYQENVKGVKEVLGYDANQIAAFGGDGVNSSLNMQRTNFVLGRGFDSFGFKLEAGFQSGETGVTKGTQDVSVNGYGIAAELYIPRAESKWDWKLKLGMATGDDPSSTDFGGYAFNRNYDAGMLLFNHRLGQRDFLNTDVYKNTTTLNVGNSADDESISNAMYIAPSVGYAWNDRVDVRNTLVYGQLLNTVKNSVDSAKDLGLEWDIEVIYKPSERIQWVNQVGLLFPGEAWKNGNDGLGNGFTFGFASKAAISF
ncbi:alginate export family protein [Bdellovibrio sp. BCCA]|uniref:alginate export family protein n=1 Tax=Bdellovibrio sp. BCCA TaxID=3136281 RepID=UPI0030F0D511